MENQNFEQKLAEFQSSFAIGEHYEIYYSFKDTWKNVGTSSLDKKFIELVDFYIDLDNKQKRKVKEFVRKYRLNNSLLIFIQRLGALIESADDLIWFKRGITAAIIEDFRIDYRDTVVSMNLLCYRVEKFGINTQALSDEIIIEIEPEHKGKFSGFTDKGMHTWVQKFGPAEWVEDSINSYGEIEGAAELRASIEKTENDSEFQEKLRAEAAPKKSFLSKLFKRS